MSSYRSIALVLLLAVTDARAAEYLSLTGEELYLRFCASCHGVSGRGDGSLSDYFAVEVPDLTLLTRRAGGVYPMERVIRIIDGRHILGAHGSRAMPVWGEDLNLAHAGEPEAERSTQTIIGRIAAHVARLQRPRSLKIDDRRAR